LRNRLGLVIALLAGCKGEPAPASKGGPTHVVAAPLPTVGADARLAPDTDLVPGHEIVIDAAGRIATVAANKRWSEVVSAVDGPGPLALPGLADLANTVHRELKDWDDSNRAAEEAAAEQRELDRLMADGKTEAEARETMATTRYEPMPHELGPYRFADRPDSAIPATGDGRAVRDAAPARVPMLTAVIGDTLPPEPFLFVAAGTAPAAILVDALVATSGGMIAVAAPRGVRALRLRFKHIDPEHAHFEDAPWASWIELRIGAGGAIELEAVPGTPIRLTGDLDAATLQQAIAKVGATRPALAADHTIDVLVDDGADVQRLVGVLAALDLAGLAEIGLGRAPRASDGDVMRGSAVRFIPVPAIELDPGEGGTVPVRELIVQQMAAIRTCFADAPASESVVIHAKKDPTTGEVLPEIEGEATPLARCVLARLDQPVAQQGVAFKVRFDRAE